jgi:hypothetical protein
MGRDSGGPQPFQQARQAFPMRKKTMPSHESIRLDGRTYVSHSCWTFGDHGGAGSVGKANIRYLLEECEGHAIEIGMGALRHVSEGCPYGLGADELAEIRAERPWLIHAYGDYGSEQVWIRKPIALRTSSHGFRGDTWLEQMERYPCFSDDIVSEIEMDWETEAWNDWLWRDLVRTLPDDGTQDEAESLGRAALWEAYRAAMEDTNTYAEPELNGVHVDVDRIKEAFADCVVNMVSDLYTP